MLVADPDKTINLWAMLKGMETQGHLTDVGADQVGREGS